MQLSHRRLQGNQLEVNLPWEDAKYHRTLADYGVGKTMTSHSVVLRHGVEKRFAAERTEKDKNEETDSNRERNILATKTAKPYPVGHGFALTVPRRLLTVQDHQRIDSSIDRQPQVVIPRREFAHIQRQAVLSMFTLSLIERTDMLSHRAVQAESDGTFPIQ